MGVYASCARRGFVFIESVPPARRGSARISGVAARPFSNRAGTQKRLDNPHKAQSLRAGYYVPSGICVHKPEKSAAFIEDPTRLPWNTFPCQHDCIGPRMGITRQGGARYAIARAPYTTTSLNGGRPTGGSKILPLPRFMVHHIYLQTAPASQRWWTGPSLERIQGGGRGSEHRHNNVDR